MANQPLINIFFIITKKKGKKEGKKRTRSEGSKDWKKARWKEGKEEVLQKNLFMTLLKDDKVDFIQG